MKRIGDGDYSVNKYVAVVTAFIVAASLLVVLTTFAINMLTATGDLNRLMYYMTPIRKQVRGFDHLLACLI